jgi:DNA-binding MarR family transcriptional regulator
MSLATRSTSRKKPADQDERARAAAELSELVPRLNRLLRSTLDADPRAPSLEQLRVMLRIDEGHDTVSALASVRQMRMSAITSLVDALVARKWVTRRADDLDRRRTRLALTTSGRAALRRGSQRTTDQMAQVLDLDDGSTRSLLDVLDRLSKAASAYDAKRPRSSTSS